MTTTTTTAYVREHLAQLDLGDFAATLVPPMFRDVDYANLNGIEGIHGIADPGTNTETEWDFARYAW